MKTINSLKPFCIAVAIVGLTIFGHVAHATIYNWTNTAGGAWSTAANWNPNGVPGASDTAVITNAGVTVSLNGTTTVGGIILGTNGAGTVTLAMNGQTLFLNGPLTVNPSGSFTVDSGTLAGNTNAVLTGTIGWSASSLGGILTLAPGGTLNLTTANSHNAQSLTLTNNGTVVWAAGNIQGGGSPATTIINNGLWDCQSDQIWNNVYGGNGTVFNNRGTFRKSISLGSYTWLQGGVQFNNTGNLDSRTNTIYLDGGGSFTGGTATNLNGIVALEAGAFNINGTVTSSNVQMISSATLIGNNVINGAFNWIQGDWNGSASETIATNSILYITSAAAHNLQGCTVTNNGTVAWINGTLQSGGTPGTLIVNNGVWDAQGDNVWNDVYGGNGTVFNNAGTFRKSISLGSYTWLQGGVQFNNTGNLDSRTNTIYLDGGGSFTGGTATNLTGFVVLEAGAFNLNGTVTSTNCQLNGGGATLTGNNVIKGVLTWVVGDWNNSASETIATNSTLYIVSANNHNLQNCTVTNNGTVVWANGNIQSGGTPGTTVVNNGLWDCKDDLTWDDVYGGNGTAFNNNGTLRKSGSTTVNGSTLFQGGVAINNTGKLDAQTNYLNFQGGGNLTGGTATNLNGYVYLAAGAFTINGTVGSTNLQLAGGTLTGNNVINGALNWIIGDWNNSAAETIAPGATLLVTSGNDHNMQNCTVTNNGTVTWQAGNIRGGGNPGTVIVNNGLWDCQSDQQVNTAYGGNGVVFNNYGLFRKSGGAGNLGPTYTLIAGGVFFNQLAGVIDTQNGTNGLELVFQGGGNFTGGYVTTNKFGLTVLSLGSFNINGTVTGTNTWENNGNLVGTNVIHGTLTWVGGLWNGAVVTISPNSTVLVNGGGGLNDMNAAIVTNSGTMKWASGQIRGGNGTTIYNYGLWDAQSDQQLNDAYGGAGTFFNNFGTFRKSGGTGNTVLTGGVLFTQTSGLLSALTGNIYLQGSGNFSGGSITNGSSGITYLNQGSFNLVGTLTDTNVIENAGNLVGNNVINGALNWVAGNWNGAIVTISSNSVVTVAGGAGLNDFNAGVVTNYGTVAWASGQMRGGNGATVYNYGLWDAQSDQQLNDAFGGAGTFFNNFGTFRKSGGTGDTIVAGGVLFTQTSGLLSALTGNIYLEGGGNFSGGSVTTSSTGTNYLNAGNFNIVGTITSGNVIENAGILVGNNVINGVLTWVAGNWDGASVTISNNSVVTIAGGGGVNDFNAGVVTNYGTVFWTSGQIRGGNGSAIYNYGLWDAQSDQQLNDAFGGAGTFFNNFGTFRKEATTGVTSIAGGVTFNNTGKLDAQNGNLALQGAYTLANGTKMGFGLGGVAGNGSISLSGAALFTGSLSVNLNGQFFWPGVGSSYNLLNYTSESGLLFTNTTLPGAGYITWQTNYNATAFVLSVIAHPATNSTPTNIFLSTLNGTNLFLQWPGDHTGWRLQGQTNSLSVGLRTNWATVSGAELTNQFILPTSKTNGAVFFRMIYP